MIFCIRRNLTASGPRPNPQGSYYYGSVPLNRTIVLENYPAIINGKQRYIVNSASFIPGDTPFKLADYFQIPGLFTIGSILIIPLKLLGSSKRQSWVPSIKSSSKSCSKTLKMWSNLGILMVTTFLLLGKFSFICIYISRWWEIGLL